MTDRGYIRELSIDSRLAASEMLHDRRFQAEQLLAALNWKQNQPEQFPLIASLIGGTGTGKSTLFNSLAGDTISDVGIRRPCTLSGIVFVHDTWRESFATCPLAVSDASDPSHSTAGLIVKVHSNDRFADVALVDTPDFDSVEQANQVIAENLFILCDLMIFVTSQEKYGDLTGLKMRERAREWGKRTLFVMNKVTSDSAFHDFEWAVRESRDSEHAVVRVARLKSDTELIADLPQRDVVRRFLGLDLNDADEYRSSIREEEIERLKVQAHRSLEHLETSLFAQMERVSSVNHRIDRILSSTTAAMEASLDAVLTAEAESRIQDHLKSLLRKYDILFVPRTAIRKAVRKVIGLVSSRLGVSNDSGSDDGSEQDIRTQDFRNTWSRVRLEPVEASIAALNHEIATFLASDPSLEDLRTAALNDVKRMDSSEIRSLFDEAFSSVEQLLETEFNQFREGLTGWDEAKLYGSYTLWALLLVTVEIVLGGGFTVLDAALNTVIVPFIPKWLLSLKVIGLLKGIGQRVDQQYRESLRMILDTQALRYKNEFQAMLPDGGVYLEHIRGLKQRMPGDA